MWGWGCLETERRKKKGYEVFLAFKRIPKIFWGLAGGVILPGGKFEELEKKLVRVDSLGIEDFLDGT